MNKYIIKVNGTPYEVEVEEVGGGRPVAVSSNPRASKPGHTASARLAQPQAGKPGDVAAPMPGTVLKLKVNLGDEVKKGQVLLILEAMKMENEIVAPADGKVTVLTVEAGKSVTAGELMASIA
ncbi:biotin/lipoyl attachment domain-containing protein [Ruminiclostridium papyrosolvens DSM 2782]|uniref:Biotin/lipoyl attachment domain-containing protein n=1 Tax=Ruminiclostridium papyrosolvens DSM 2782 TaxID=588581 RepID=F1T9Z7_9FIRM|nr:biotin/lipoyl-containing protein [Ruminiclostridium papyrosolvens]EGD48739.1 biotin/lipoyl attachment domain-containing protein [Ruminiclostridium papyrosolvens DSM 2782]WES32505.1 biotin/lipoyl-binding protein [Ruminiclostridium papyrosolvens DSM 2782]